MNTKYHTPRHAAHNTWHTLITILILLTITLTSLTLSGNHAKATNTSNEENATTTSENTNTDTASDNNQNATGPNAQTDDETQGDGDGDTSDTPEGADPNAEGEDGGGNQAPAIDSVGGSISGTLWLDTLEDEDTGATYGDGIHQPSEGILPDYPVDLYTADNLDTPIDTVTTDETGTYTFTGVEPGEYKVGITTTTIDDVEYLLPLTGITADNHFTFLESDENYTTVYSDTHTINNDGTTIDGINAGIRTPPGITARAGVVASRGARIDTPKCTDHDSYNWDTYTIVLNSYSMSGNTVNITADVGSRPTWAYPWVSDLEFRFVLYENGLNAANKVRTVATKTGSNSFVLNFQFTITPGKTYYLAAERYYQGNFESATMSCGGQYYFIIPSPPSINTLEVNSADYRTVAVRVWFRPF